MYTPTDQSQFQAGAIQEGRHKLAATSGTHGLDDETICRTCVGFLLRDERDFKRFTTTTYSPDSRNR